MPATSRYTLNMSESPANPRLISALRAIATDIKLSHSVFALPFAVLAMFLAAGWADRFAGLDEVGLIVLCMVLARTVAMAVNRWADASIDAANPRTQGRAIPSGRVSPAMMLNVAIFCGLGFIAAAAGFWVLRDNVWPVVLSPLVLAYLVGYSWTKRVTWLCHVYLGTALALSPLAAAIAIEPGYWGEPTVWLLALVVATWVAGFDVIYALQDVEVDRREGLWSMPSRLGVGRSLWISRGLHVVTIAALFGVWATGGGLAGGLLGWTFLVATTVTAVLLVIEHLIAAGGETAGIPLMFVTVNGLISIVLGAAGVFDVWRSVG